MMDDGSWFIIKKDIWTCRGPIKSIRSAGGGENPRSGYARGQSWNFCAFVVCD